MRLVQPAAWLRAVPLPRVIFDAAAPTLRAAWDPANFVQVLGADSRPHDQGYALLRPYIDYVHVKDAKAAEGQVVPAGKGDGQIRETIAALREIALLRLKDVV